MASKLSIDKFGLGFLAGKTWDPVRETFGALPVIYGTLITSLLALVLAIPVSLGTAIFLAEVAPPWLRTPASYVVEVIAAVPSVILGLWGIFVLVPFVRDPIELFLGSHFGWVPLFQGPPFGIGPLAAGMILAVMIVPIITSVSRDVLLAVPVSQREAMLALGATRWETIAGVVIPYGRSGVVGAVILALGRAMGETMAVTMVIGNGFKISPSLFQPSHTIASLIASEFTEVSSKLYLSALIETGLILLAMSLIVNVCARILVGTLVRVPGTVRE